MYSKDFSRYYDSEKCPNQTRKATFRPISGSLCNRTACPLRIAPLSPLLLSVVIQLTSADCPEFALTCFQSYFRFEVTATPLFDRSLVDLWSESSNYKVTIVCTKSDRKCPRAASRIAPNRVATPHAAAHWPPATRVMIG